MRVKLTYYGQEPREFDLLPGDLLRWVEISGAHRSGTFIEGVPGGNHTDGLRVLIDGSLTTVKRSLIFRLRVENRDASPSPLLREDDVEGCEGG